MRWIRHTWLQQTRSRQARSFFSASTRFLAASHLINLKFLFYPWRRQIIDFPEGSSKFSSWQRKLLLFGMQRLLLMISSHRRRCCSSFPHRYWCAWPSFLSNHNSSFKTVSSNQRGWRRRGTVSLPDFIFVLNLLLTRGHGASGSWKSSFFFFLFFCYMLKNGKKGKLHVFECYGCVGLEKSCERERKRERNPLFLGAKWKREISFGFVGNIP